MLSKLKDDVCSTSNLWTEFNPNLSVDDSSVCAHHRSFSSGGRRKLPILSSPTDSADFDDASGGGSSPVGLNNEHPTSPAVVTKTPQKTAKTLLSEETTIETINMEKQDQHTRSKHQTPQNTDTAVATEKPHTPQKNTYIEIQEQNIDSISLSDFNTPQPLASSTPKMIDSTTSPMDKQYTSFLTQSYEKSQNEPLTHLEEKVHTNFVKRKLYQNPHQLFSCKTKGQPIVLKKIVIPRKDSKVVRTPTKKKRAQLIHRVRQQVAGPSKASTDAQQVSELNLLPITTRREVTSKAGIKERASMTTEAALAMKETVGLTWSQLRIQRKFLKSSGLTLPSEKKKRKYGKQLISKYIRLDSKDFNLDGQIECRPYVAVDNISDYLTSILDMYKENNQLTWHSGTIPDDEVWVKIGADHGKGSFKEEREGGKGRREREGGESEKESGREGRGRARGRERGGGRSEAEEEIKRAFFVAMILSNQGKIT